MTSPGYPDIVPPAMEQLIERLRGLGVDDAEASEVVQAAWRAGEDEGRAKLQAENTELRRKLDSGGTGS